MTPKELRALISKNEFNKPTSGVCPNYVQANLAILPKSDAYDFLLFCQRNPKPCPLIEVLDAGEYLTKICADNADIRTSIPKYRIYKKGELVDEVSDIINYFKDDYVSFLMGCSFSFEAALINHKIPLRHIEEDHNVPMYITNTDCLSAGKFHGKMVVSMRPIKYKDLIRATTTTALFPSVHGAPIHIGNPSEIGIKDISKPDFGDASTIYPDEVCVFWACGVTPQSIALTSKPEIMITHSPGYMFVTDKQDNEYSVF
ncbi:putative hydro-lyase [Campylobacter sp. Cr9]|nr:putative hydro-lyase [Campylobacter sp. Cr9]